MHEIQLDARWRWLVYAAPLICHAFPPSSTQASPCLSDAGSSASSLVSSSSVLQLSALDQACSLPAAAPPVTAPAPPPACPQHDAFAELLGSMLDDEEIAWQVWLAALGRARRLYVRQPQPDCMPFPASLRAELPRSSTAT